MDRTSQFLNKNILVAGGTGFLGFHIASSLCKFGANVYSLSQRPPGKHRHLNIQYLYHDLSIPFPSVHPIRSFKFDYIFNCSGYVDHSSFFDGGINVISTNINSVLHLIETLNWSLLYLLSNLAQVMNMSISPPQSESCTPIPLTPYSLSKFSITNLLRSLSISENHFIIVRPFLVYGPHQDSNRLFPYVINNCISDSTFTLTSGLQLHDFLYIDDFVEAVLCLACTQKPWVLFLI